MDEIESKGVFRRTKSGISGDNKIESIVSNVSRGRSLWTKLETKGLFRRAKLALVEGEEKEEIKSCRSFQRVERERETFGEKFAREIKRENLYTGVQYNSCCVFLDDQRETISTIDIYKKEKRYFAILTSTNFSSRFLPSSTV